MHKHDVHIADMGKSYPLYSDPRPTDFNSPKRFDYLPKNIFQTWEVRQVSPKMYHAIQSWKILNPDWNYYFFSQHERREFIKQNFSIRILNAYDTLIPGAYKADLWRYCVLYMQGGIYADTKILLCNPLNRLLDSETQFVSVKEREGSHHLNGAVWNTFIASVPKHPFLKSAIDKIVYNVDHGEYGENALYPTGPFLLGSAINSVLGRKKNAHFDVGKQKIESYQFYLWYIPKNKQSIQCVYKNKDKKVACFLPSYLGYKEEKKFYSKTFNSNYDYAYCWRNYKIYRKKVNPKKLLYPRLKQIKFAYKSSDNSRARQLIFDTLFKYSQIHIKLFRYFIQYELINLFSRLNNKPRKLIDSRR